jgi:hypothetical protein
MPDPRTASWTSRDSYRAVVGVVTTPFDYVVARSHLTSLPDSPKRLFVVKLSGEGALIENVTERRALFYEPWLPGS